MKVYVVQGMDPDCKIILGAYTTEPRAQEKCNHFREVLGNIQMYNQIHRDRSLEIFSPEKLESFEKELLGFSNFIDTIEYFELEVEEV